MPMNEAAAADHVCPGIRIHVIDIVEPPGMAMPPGADIGAYRAIVSAALATKSSADTANRAGSDATRCGIALARLAKAARIARLSARRTRRAGATRSRPRCAPSARDRATGTHPIAHPGRAHRWNTCDTRC